MTSSGSESVSDRYRFDSGMRLTYIVIGALVLVALAALASAVLIAKFVGGWSGGLGAVGAAALTLAIWRLNSTGKGTDREPSSRRR